MRGRMAGMSDYRLNMRTMQQRRSIVTEYARCVQLYRDQPDLFEPNNNFAWQLYPRLCAENVAELVSLTPADVLAEIKDAIARAPKTEAGWEELVFINCDKSDYREGLEVLKAYFDSHNGS
jgi:hypothetical protein